MNELNGMNPNPSMRRRLGCKIFKKQSQKERNGF